ncbi:hypothetical protein [Treponema sp.]|uniref:hypothetical protein n=1 Tax=Treponema sp. TaxID=166 RepID=UPI003EFCBBC7
MTLDDDYNLIVVKPKSRKDIERAAMKARKFLKIAENVLYIDILSILEFQLQSFFDDDVTFLVPDEWYREEEAYYDTQKNIIFIRSDVYDKAVKGDGRARFTIMHEIAHYILFKEWGLPYKIPLKNIVVMTDATLKSMDPEWQANTFTGAFMCSKEYVKKLKIEEIEISCGLSRKAAEVCYCCSRGIPYCESEMDMEEFSNWSYIFAMQNDYFNEEALS